MKNRAGLIVIGAFVTTLLYAQDKKAPTYRDPGYGFSIEAPAFEAPPKKNVQPVFFYGPPVEGFAPYLNVIVEHGNDMGLDKYLGVALPAAKKQGVEILKETRQKIGGKDAALLETKRAANGQEFKLYQLIVATGKSVYVVTASTRASEWDRHAPLFKKSIDSFKLD